MEYPYNFVYNSAERRINWSADQPYDELLIQFSTDQVNWQVAYQGMNLSCPFVYPACTYYLNGKQMKGGHWLNFGPVEQIVIPST